MSALKALTLSLLLAVSALAAGGRALAQSEPKITVATTPIDLGAEALYAQDLGFFKKAGLDVNVMVLSAGPAVAAAVAGGSVDIGQANIVSLANAHAHGVPFVAIAPAGYYTSKAPTTVMIAAANSTIRTPKDLEGKTVAVVTLGDITQVGASAWLTQGGADVHAVHFLEAPQPEVCTAITSGRAEAGVVSEPYLSIALAHGCRVLAPCHDAIAPQFLVGAWFSTSAWAQEHPAIVRRFAAVISETARWANAHHDDSERILAKYTHAQFPPGMRRVPFAETKTDPRLMQPLIDAAAKYGSLKTSFPAAELLASQ